jgi:DNA-binding NtrC family response regulator
VNEVIGISSSRKGTVMNEQGILIADRDTATRRLLADVLLKAGYRVKTTDSAADVLSDILRKQAHVILVGSDFDEKVAASDLIPMIKRCDRNLTIILVADEESLPMVRKIRQEGIFYHALKPVSAEDGEEIRQVVECAFKNVINVLSIH